MIIPELYGGLGNNLFQIAAAYALAREVNTPLAINYERHSTPCFFHPIRYKDNLFKKINSTTATFKNVYYEPNFTYDKIPYQNNVILNGYFQSLKYFEKYKEEVKKLFTFPDSVKYDILQKIENVEGEFIINHIRRGDYKNNKTYSNISKDYYKQAHDFIESKEQKKLKNIFVTDDKDQVRTEFGNNNIIIETKNEIEDMFILTLGNYFVGCNSTFSWWGSFFGKHKLKIFPKKWFHKGGETLKSKDIYRDDLLCI